MEAKTQQLATIITNRFEKNTNHKRIKKYKLCLISNCQNNYFTGGNIHFLHSECLLYSQFLFIRYLLNNNLLIAK